MSSNETTLNSIQAAQYSHLISNNNTSAINSLANSSGTGMTLGGSSRGQGIGYFKSLNGQQTATANGGINPALSSNIYTNGGQQPQQISIVLESKDGLHSMNNPNSSIIPQEMISSSQQYYEYVPSSQIAKIKAANVTRKRSSMLSNYPDPSGQSGQGTNSGSANPVQMIPLPSSPNRRQSPALQTTSNTSTAMATPGAQNLKNSYIPSGNQYHHMMLGATLSAQSTNLHPASLLQIVNNSSIIVQSQQSNNNLGNGNMMMMSRVHQNINEAAAQSFINNQLQQTSPKTRATMLMNMTLSNNDQFNMQNKMMLGTSSALGTSQLKKAFTNGQQTGNSPFANMQLNRSNPLTGGSSLQPQLNTTALLAAVTGNANANLQQQQQQFRQRSIVPPGHQQQQLQPTSPYQTSVNGIAGSFLNLYPTAQGVNYEPQPEPPCQPSQALLQDKEADGTSCDNSLLIQSQQDEQIQPPNLTQNQHQQNGVTTASSSPMKAYRGAGVTNHNNSLSNAGGPSQSTSSVNNSQLSTAVSSQYNIKKKVTMSTQPSTQNVGQTNNAQAQVTPMQQKYQQPSTRSTGQTNQNAGGGGNLNQSFISTNAINQQPVNPPPQSLVIITVSNNAQPPNLSAGVPNAKKASNNAGGMGNGGQMGLTLAQQAGSQQITTNDHKDPKQALLMSIQEIVRLVIQRSEDINLLRQAVDLKIKKFKPKYTDSSFFYNLLQREWQRQSVEGYHLNKTGNVRVEDKSPLIKTLQKQVKKMLKHFNRRRLNEDYLQAEVHLSEVLIAQDVEVATSYFLQQHLQASSQPTIPTLQSLLCSQDVMSQVQNPSVNKDSKDQPPPQYKDLKKRPVRLIQASFKETLVDPQVALSICIQYSRQAFFDEVSEYFQCAQDIILAAVPGTIPTNCNLQTENLNYQNLKKVINKARLQAKVQINLHKKLDKMYKVLYDQNAETMKQIAEYKERYQEAQKRKQQSKSVIIEQLVATVKQQQFRKEPGTLSASPNKIDRQNGAHSSMLEQQQTNGINVNHQPIKHLTSSNVATYFDLTKSQPESQRLQKDVQGTQRFPVHQNTQQMPPDPQQSNLDTSINLNKSNMNSTLSNFINAGGTPSQSSSKVIQLNNAANLLRGSTRGINKLQPIIIPRSEISQPPPFLATPSKNSSLLDTSIISNLDNSQLQLSRTIKKANQLPSLQTNSTIVTPASIQDQLLGGNASKMSNMSKRGNGFACLEPLPSDHQSTIEAKVAALRHQGESQSTSPLKRRHKVVIQDLNRLNQPLEDMALGPAPLLKVYHSSANSQMDDNESMRASQQQQSSRKVIKATITIPMPKADLAVVKFKSGNSRRPDPNLFIDKDGNEVDQMDGNDTPSEEEMQFEDDPSPTQNDAQIYETVNLSKNGSTSVKGFNEPISTFSTVRQSASTSKMILGKSTFLNQPSSLIQTNILSHHQSAFLFQKPPALLDLSKVPVNDRFDSLFSRYFNKKGIMAFILNHRARVLQRFFRQRMQYKLAAKRLIVKRFRLFIARQQRVHLFATKLFITVTQKKAVRAIERAYIRYRDRLRSTLKNRKNKNIKSGGSDSVTEVNLIGEQVIAKYKEHENKIRHIQKYYRKRLGKRYAHGRKLVKRKDMLSQILHQWSQARYIPISGYEAQLLHNQIQVMHHKQLVDEYTYSLQDKFMIDLFKYDQDLVKAVETEFREREWFYSHQNKEWQSEKKQITFKSTQNAKINGISHPALQYLIDQNRRLLLNAPVQSFEEIQGVSEAINGLYSVEHRNQRYDILKKIKRSRHNNLLNPSMPFKKETGKNSQGGKYSTVKTVNSASNQKRSLSK